MESARHSEQTSNEDIPMMLSILDTRKLNADAQEKLLLSELNTTFRELAAIRQEQAINDATMYSPTSEATLSLYALPQFTLNPIK